MSYGLKIAKEGFDANDPTIDRKNLTFDSTLEHFQFRTSGSLTYTVAELKTIAHNLGYVPAFIAYIKKNGSTKWEFLYRNSSFQDAYVDDTNIYIYGELGDQVRYYIFTKPLDSTVVTDVYQEGGYGIISVVPNANANEPRESEINFNSAWGSFIILKEFTLDLEVTTAGTYTETTAHGMGYAPAFIANVYDGFNYYPNPFIFDDLFGLEIKLKVYVDSTNITVECEASASAVPLTAEYRVHLFTESLE